MKEQIDLINELDSTIVMVTYKMMKEFESLTRGQTRRFYKELTRQVKRSGKRRIHTTWWQNALNTAKNR